MKNQLSVLVFVNLFLCVPALSTGIAGRGETYKVPWEIIAEKFDAKLFCTAINKNKNANNFALDPNSLILLLPQNIKIIQEQTEAELGLSVWQRDKWVTLPPLAVQLDSNSIVIGNNMITDGFYKLSLRRKENYISRDCEFYAIVMTDWKRDLLTYCRYHKEQIEINPDSQLIYSSIAVSHFDHLMGLVSSSSVLSERILDTMVTAIHNKKTFEQGECPDFVRGLNKIRLKRFEGDLTEEFVVFIPDTYKSSKPEAIFLHPDNRRWAARDNYIYHSGLIDIWWLTVDDKEINWKSYQYFFEVLKQKLNLDENRVYINGACGNGLAAMSLMLKFPDKWAECSMSLGNTYRHMAGNALNLPLIFVKGPHYNAEWAIGYYDFAVECFKYYGCRFFKHSKLSSIVQVRGGSVPTKIRVLSPKRVFYTIESLANSKAYWVQIDGREDENFIASIDATVSGQSIWLKTNNVDAYTLNLELAPINHTRTVKVIENGEHLDFVTGPAFVRKSSKYNNALFIKNESIHGPVADIFTEQYAVVWTGDENIQKFAEQLAGTGPCFADANLPLDFINTHNIVLVGRPWQSKYFQQVVDKLPVIVEDNKLTIDNKVYKGDLGVILIYPNPVNTQKYIALFFGTSDKAFGLLDSAWEQIKSDANVDVGVFEVTKNNQIKWLRREKFNTVWDWHESWDVPLAAFTKSHPKWKWHQWVAKVLREQFGSDVVISEDPFKSPDLPETGEFTLRDLSRIFKNDWIVKISFKGRKLKKLLSVAFNDIFSREVSAPVIDGVSFNNSAANLTQILNIEKIENETIYTVALPYKALNGKRMGVRIKDYRIEGQGFLVTLLKEYLIKNAGLDLDTELDSMKPNLF